MQPAEVYTNAWAAVKKLVSRCYAHGIGVLIDLHAAPGGANSESHSGTSRGQAELWRNKFNLDLATRCLCFVVQEVVNSGLEGVIGIQPCNEAKWDAPGLYEWYDKVISEISKIDPSLPIYISDAWDLQRALKYTASKNSVQGTPTNPIIVDTHKYSTFAEKDTSRSPQELIAQVSTELGELNGLTGNVFDSKGATAAFVGEYSCTLSPQTWKKVTETDRPGLTTQFGRAQVEKWQSKACGSAFWNLKMDWMPGGDWGFMEQVDAGAVTAPWSLRMSFQDVERKLKDSESKRSSSMMAAVAAHHRHWDHASRGGYFEHWRFADGVSDIQRSAGNTANSFF